jgi:hypothetical protein
VSARLEPIEEWVDVVSAARLVDRHPETIRRWIWSGRLTARRQGRRMLVARSHLGAVAGRDGSLLAWATRVSATRLRAETPSARQTAADLILSDRRRRSEVEQNDAGR